MEIVETITKKSRVNYGISREAFIEVWNSPDTKTITDVVTKTKMPLNVVNVRASILRKKGTSLKKLERRNAQKTDMVVTTVPETNVVKEEKNVSTTVQSA